MEKAEAARMKDVKAMDVYNVKLRKRMSHLCLASCHANIPPVAIAPSRKAVQARLMTDEQDRGGNAVGITKWVMLGIDIQEMQYGLLLMKNVL